MFNNFDSDGHTFVLHFIIFFVLFLFVHHFFMVFSSPEPQAPGELIR